MKLEHVKTADPRVELIADGLNDHGRKNNMPSIKPDPFVFIASNDECDFLGGVKGKVAASWCEISWLYSTQKEKGIGRSLMETVEAHAKKLNCQGMLVETIEYQAPDFYKKFGFIEYGQITDYLEGKTLHSLLKRF
jgi:GNAT superfamily N-acetyltransferase